VAMHTSLSVCYCELFERKMYVKNCDRRCSCCGADEDSSCRGYDSVGIGKWLTIVTASSRIKFECFCSKREVESYRRLFRQ
jgi:hypothetical protein